MEPGRVVTLYRLRREHSCTLSGKAEWVSARVNQVVLRMVEPDENGTVVLCLHYLKGLRASPGRVKIERAELQATNFTSMVRLRMDAPVARLTLTWEK